MGSFKNGAQLDLEEVAQFVAAFDGLAAGAVTQSVQNPGGGLHAEIAGKQCCFKTFQSGFVDGSGEGDDAFDLGRKRLPGAGNGLLHAVEKAGFGSFRLVRVYCVFSTAKKLHSRVVQT